MRSPHVCLINRQRCVLCMRTWAACRCSTSTRPCAAAGYLEWRRWCSGRVVGPPDPRSRGPDRGPAWCCETVPAVGSGPPGCSCWGCRRQCPCWMSGSCSPSAWPPPGRGCSHSPTWPTLDTTSTERDQDRQTFLSSKGECVSTMCLLGIKAGCDSKNSKIRKEV